MKKLYILLLIFIFSISLFANPNINKPWNYKFNPALLDFGTRNFIDIGVNANLDLANPVISMGDLFKEEIVIDLNEIYDNLDGNPLPITLDLDTGLYLKLHLWSFSYAKEYSIDGNIDVSIPNAIVEFLAEGNVEDGEFKDLEGKDGIFNVDIIAQSSNYYSFGNKNYSYGIMLSKFYPVMIMRSSIDFSQTADADKGIMKIDYAVVGNVNSSLQSLSSLLGDSEDYYGPDLNEDLMETFKSESAGFKMSIGYVNGYNRKAKWGIAINDIVLKPAQADYAYTLSSTSSITIENMNIETEEGSTMLKEDEDALVMEYPNSPEDMPMSISYFFTTHMLFDFTPHFQYYMGKGLDYGVSIDGNLWIIPFWMDISKNQNVWSLNTGFGLNIHLADVNFTIGSASDTFGGMWKFEGFTVKVNVAAGI
ncbi:hypothetical protein XO10_09955 [Marinitoga sp. 1135]|uniref:DUF5723 domain-containing protein n=1 Tax=Marinitoga piezophila (strain DSM 14283 / JCM 11233 / KA3) TaxID=443254 RepID=H2J725_MARPK|nr:MULTISPECIES: hypothetical protein [Marinitoga]AEX86395.1 hypothetical protein Marpi_2019 [Marinitoga piezophila KA3]APT76786.1 hypothetical protein LN42_10675 [Marinitoga sp. 1137]NUU96556.1 hypothetical protein [Marinitoga sp. 1135]NUU98487.1 hypothetical protein [Marinitoga sp. 1138]